MRYESKMWVVFLVGLIAAGGGATVLMTSFASAQAQAETKKPNVPNGTAIPLGELQEDLRVRESLSLTVLAAIVPARWGHDDVDFSLGPRF